MSADPNVNAQARVRFTTPVNMITIEDAVIEINTDESGVIDLAGGERQIVGLQMPGAWTAATLTFDVSHNGTNFVHLYHGAGEYEIAAAEGADADLGVSLGKEALAPWPYVKIRSGNAALYVDQLAERTIKVLTKAG